MQGIFCCNDGRLGRVFVLQGFNTTTLRFHGNQLFTNLLTTLLRHAALLLTGAEFLANTLLLFFGF